MIELRRLQQFVAVIESGSLTDAAARLNQSQQALSAAIKSLEEHVGATLFERSRGMRPSPAGLRLYESTKALLAGADRLIPEVQRLAAGAPEVLRIGHTPAIGSVEVFDLLHSLLPTHARVHTKRLYPGELDAALMTGEVDIALRRGVSPKNGAEGTVVGYGRLHIAVASDDVIASRGSVRLADLADRTLVLWAPESRSPYAAFLAGQFRRVGIEPDTMVSGFQGLAPIAAPLVVDGGFAMVVADPGVHLGGRITVVELVDRVQSPVQALWLPTTRAGVAGCVVNTFVESTVGAPHRTLGPECSTVGG